MHRRSPCRFHDEYELFQEAGATVVGISSDPVESHHRFIELHQLPFLLLSDTKGRMLRLFGIPLKVNFSLNVFINMGSEVCISCTISPKIRQKGRKPVRIA